MRRGLQALLATFACLGSATSIFAAPGPPEVFQVIPASGQVTALTNITVIFSEPVSGIAVEDLLINGIPSANQLSGSGDTYTFRLEEQPPYGTVEITWDLNHTIADFDSPPSRFDESDPSSKWSYTLVDTVAPFVSVLTPAASVTVRQLTQIEVQFSEPVAGVEPADLRINGNGATGVSVSGAGRYIFTFPQPTNGTVQVTWAAGHGIIDFAPTPNAFAGGSWSYILDPNFGLPSIRINEFVAANISGLADENGDTEDWIEIWNYGSTAVNLNGYSLTDDPDDPGKWTFPSTNLAPGQFLVVFASAKDRKTLTSSTNRLHTNFQLNPSGDYVALFNPESPRVVITEFSFPEQRNNHSYGYDTTNALKYFATPTPGAANGASPISGILPPPHFNVDRGMFEAPFTLILSTPTPGATILYTINGSEPTLGGSNVLTYMDPLTITNTTVLRAAAFQTGLLPSLSVTHTYLFLDQVVVQPNRPAGFPTNWGPNASFPGGVVPADYEMDRDPLRVDPNSSGSPIDPVKLQRLKDGLRELPTVSIVMKTDDIFGTAGLYQRSAVETGTPGNKPDNKKPCSVEMILPDGTTAFATTCGIDLHGNASRNPIKNPKHGFKLNFRSDFGPPSLDYKVFDDSPVDEFDDLLLRADFNSSWRHWSDLVTEGLGGLQRTRATRTRDAWMKNSMRDMGGLASHNRFVHLYLNGLYWGTFDLSEDPSKFFAQSVLGGSEADYDIVDQGVLKAGTLSFYNSMVALPAATTLAIYEQYHQYLSVPEHVDYMLLHFLMGHQDWATSATKNWSAVRKRVAGPEGTFRYVPWDGECILLNEDINRTTVSGANFPSGLHGDLDDSPEYRLLFADHVHRHMVAPGGALLPGANIARWQKWQAIMDKPIVAESARWGDYRRDVHQYQNGVYQLYTRENHWLAEQTRMPGYFSNRTARVLGQLRAVNLYPAVSAPVFNQHGGRVARGFNLTMTATNTIHFTLDGSDPRTYGTGAVAPGAQTYSGAVTITNSVIVKARALHGTSWSALAEAPFQADTLGTPLRITELMYNPIGGDTYEYIELQNVGSTMMNIGNFSFDGVSYVFPPNTMLAPGATLVLGSDEAPANWNARYPGVTVFGRFGAALNNGGEKLAIRDPDGNVVYSVDYDDDNGWPALADGQGYSLQIIDVFGDPDDPANWRASDAPNGTPGTQVGTPPAGPVVINEIMADNLTAVPNGGTFPDWIELRNAGGSPVNISGWSLSDDGDPRKFVFPANTTLAGNGHLVVWCDATTNTTPGLHTGFALGRNGESVFLYNANTVRVDSVTFGLQITDLTVGRISNSWRLTTPTPNAPNQAATLGSTTNLTINEWLADAVPGGSDWVELYNRSGTTPVALDGIYLGNGNTIFQVTSLSFVPPGGFVQLFADEVPGPDHLDFKLTAAGGDIVLYDEAAAERERVSYTVQVQGVTEGRLPDGTPNIVAFPASPSPAASNYLINYTGARLNELIAINETAVTNGPGRTPDWIELRNTNGVPFDLSGMRLSTDVEEPLQWVFPSGVSIPGNGYLVVWFDDGQPASTAAGPNLNTGRALDGESGDVYLFNPAGQVVDSVAYGFQVPDMSIGIASGNWTLLGSPTPGMANSAAATLGSPSALRLNEWMADPASGDDWFEIYNNSDQPVALAALFVTDNMSIPGLTQSQFAPLSYVGARGFVQCIADGERRRGRHHVSFNLDGNGEALRIFSATLGIIDTAFFGQQLPGVSQGRLPDGGPTIVTFTTTPTPAESNYLPLPSAVINELLSHTDLPLEDAVELFNPTGTDVDIGGWFLSDSPRNFKKYRFAAGTTIPGLGHKVIYQNALTGGAAALVPFTFDSAHGDAVYLSRADAGGNLTGYRAVARFGAAANGVSFGRFPTTVGVDFPPLSQRTFGVDNPGSVTEFRNGGGAVNAYPRIGPVILNELMFHPPGDGTNDNVLDEFIELYNVTTNPVALYDPANPGNTWRIRGGVDYEFPSGVMVGSRSFALVVSFNPTTNTAALNSFRAKYGVPPSVAILGPYRGKLDNGGEEIELYRPDLPQTSGPDAGFVPYLLTDRVEYDDMAPWPLTTDGGGASLQRRRPYDYGNDPVNWKGEGPTAGRPNLAGSTYTDADADGISDEWEAANGLNPANRADADQDLDIDGQSNLKEYFSGTNPNSSQSVLAAPVITSHPEGASVPAGDPVTFSVTATGSGSLTYQWRLNGRNLPGATEPDLTISHVQFPDAGQYEVAVANAVGYAVSRPATLVVLIPPRFTQHPQSITILNSNNVTFTVAGVGTGVLSYQWRFNEVNIPGATGPTLTLTNVQLNNDGAYTAVLTDEIGSVTSESAVLRVLMRPIITQQPSSLTVAVGEPASFTVRVQGSVPLGFRWRRSGSAVTNIVLNDTNCMLFIPSARTNDAGVYTVIITNAAFVAPGLLSGSATLTVLPAPADADSDGMPDAWEMQYMLRPNDNTDAGEDADGDGMTNLEEYRAGTDPRDDQSFLGLRITRSGGVLLRFNAVSGKSYRVEYRDSLSTGAWQVLQNVPAGATRLVEINDPAGGASRYYRLRSPGE
ncbi:MAG: lamin tail domain-containing protein [Verrucomicrobia subdivision 3 bacterium]|nr:lamin tail domain-containing protein [Limisphaerales bacterium]